MAERRKYNPSVRREEDQLEQLGELGYGIASLAPVTGEIIAAKEAKELFEEGSYGMGMFTALGAVPIVGSVLRPALKGAKALMETPIMSSAKNVVNQTAANMPTTIKGFYEGNPIGSFARDFTAEVGGAVRTRTDAGARAFQDLWGVSATKVQDIMGAAKPAQKELNKAQRQANTLREAGLHKEADKVLKQGETAARKTAQDSEFTGLSIEAQMSPKIIPVEERGALANSVYGLNYFSRGVAQSDTAKLASEIGNGNRVTEAGKIPDNVTNQFVNHLTKGPHVGRTDELYEFQVKAMDTSRTVGRVEAEGFKRGSMLVRAFNTGSAGSKNKTTFQLYSDRVNKLNKQKEIQPEEAIEFLQLAATMNNRNTNTLNKMLKSSFVKKDPEDTFTAFSNKKLLEEVSLGRAQVRAGKTVPPERLKVLNAFEKAVRGDKIAMSKVTDDAGNQVGGLDFSKIKKPKGNVKAQSYYLSAQKELGGVNQMMVMDIKNKTNYSMMSDGHDIFGEAPLGGHHLVTAQPIVKRSWNDTGFTVQHKAKATADQIESRLADTAKRVGVEVPKALNKSNFNDPDEYYKAAKGFTDGLMRRSVKPTATQVSQAKSSTNKLRGAQGAGLLTGAVVAERTLSDDE